MIVEQLQAMTEANGQEMGQGSVFSLTLATVKDIKDDKNLNRVKCLPIDAKSDNEMTDWCYVMAPMGGKESGLFLFPQVGDLVVLGYLRNDPHSPIVLGSYWNSETTPPLPVKDGKNMDYRLITPKKVDLSIHDEDKKQKLTITMPSGTVVEIEDEKQTLTAKSSDGKTQLLMKLKDGEVELTAGSKITLTAGQASVTLEKNGKITLKGSDAVTAQGKSITLKAQGKVAAQGMDVEVKATKDLNMSATANASLKGMLLKLN
jgi:uncharacterized protein involved in type VI secretion and phage assembly